MFGKTLSLLLAAGKDPLAPSNGVAPQLRALGEPMSDEDLHHRAELVAKVIETRGKLRVLGSKVEQLQAALQRFSDWRDANKH